MDFVILSALFHGLARSNPKLYEPVPPKRGKAYRQNPRTRGLGDRIVSATRDIHHQEAHTLLCGVKARF